MADTAAADAAADTANAFKILLRTDEYIEPLLQDGMRDRGSSHRVRILGRRRLSMKLSELSPSMASRNLVTCVIPRT